MTDDAPELPARRASSGLRLGSVAALLGAFVLGIGATLLFQNRAAFSGFSRGDGPPPLVLVGLDGADWNIIDPLINAGKMPNLAGLIKRGAKARLLTINPILSPVIWTSMATGVKPERHGIVDFTAVNSETGEAIPVTSNLRRVPALWNILSDAGRKVGFVGWWASFPAEHVSGYIVSDRIAYQLFGVKADPSPEGKTWPPSVYKEIQPLIMDPTAVPDSLTARFFEDPSVLSTTDPEEQELLKQFRTILASSETYRKVSAKLDKEFSPDVASVYFEGTDTVAHLFMRDRPPQLAGVSPAAVRRFGGIIDRYYAYTDELLGEIIARHGQDANYVICSDHGFRTDRDRPLTSDSRIDRGRGADWHRRYGILVVSGPAARAGTEIREATVLDIAPTVLALAGQAIPPDLDGRVLTDAFTDEFQRKHPLRTLETAGEGPKGGPTKGAAGAPVATDSDDEIRQRLISLGYLTQESNNAHNNRGIMLLGRNEYDRAISEFQAALRDNPTFAVGLVNIARAYWAKGDNATAIDSLRKAQKISPRMREIPLMLGNVALKAGNLAEAEKEFLQALELEPNDTDALNCLGLVCDIRGDRVRAEMYYRKAVENDPDFAEGYNNLGNIFKKRGDSAQAETWYRRAIEADPFFMGAYANLALIYQERGDFDRAADLYKQALEKDNANPDLHNNLGSLLFRKGDLPAAEASFRRAIALDKAYAEGHNSLGVVFGAEGKESEEKAEYEKAIALKPGYADAMYNLGLWNIRHGNDHEAERLLKDAVRIAPDYTAAQVALAGIALRRSDPAAARSLLERVAVLQPNNARVFAMLGDACEKLSDRACAERAYRRALEIQPSQQEVEARLKSLTRK